MTTYETLVIGGGMSGLPLALRAASKGRTAFVERGELGGTCLNRGCIPTKTMIASARRAHHVRRASEFGVHHGGDVRVDIEEVVDRKDSVVTAIRNGSYRAVEQRDDLDLITGHGRFVGRHALDVDGRRVEFGRVFLNTGTRPSVPSIDGLHEVQWFDSTSILDVRSLPGHLVVIGGGYVGCEFAQMFARFGSRVTVVQRASRLLPTEDPAASALVEESFRAEGIDVLVSSECVAVASDAGGIRVECEGAHSTVVEGTHLLVAAGRTPNTDRLGLERLGVDVDERGFIPVDSQLRTNVDEVWAMGDLRGFDMFTHTARDDAEVAYRSVFKRDDGVSIADRIVPRAVFVDPELAAVGMSEAQARAAGHNVVTGRQRFAGVARAMADGETKGAVTVVADADTDRIIGASIVGSDAGNLIHEIVIAMTAGASYRQLGEALHIHPTLAEGVNAAAGGVHRPAVT